VPEPRGPDRYTVAQAARLGGCTPSQLDAWRRVGLVSPEPRGGTYSFRDLVALRMVTALLDEGVPTRRIRRAVERLLAAGDDLSSLVLVSDGDAVLACRDDGQVLDALRDGQLALFVSVGRFARDVDADVRVFAAERASFVDAISAPG
jgi:DNA-binding transcriptional MerR regulator